MKPSKDSESSPRSPKPIAVWLSFSGSSRRSACSIAVFTVAATASSETGIMGTELHGGGRVLSGGAEPGRVVSDVRSSAFLAWEPSSAFECNRW